MKVKLTDNKVWIKLVRDRHDHLLEGIHVVTITHSLTGPGDIDIPRIVKLYQRWSRVLITRPRVEDLLSDTVIGTAKVHITIFTSGVEPSILVNVE